MCAKYTITCKRRQAMESPAESAALSVSSEENPDDLSKEEIAALKRLAVYQETIAEYIMQRKKTKQLLLLNLLIGIAKGFGVALGITVVAFLGFKLLTQLSILNLPIIGNFIAELLDYIDSVQNLM